jgi:hypothetical protein
MTKLVSCPVAPGPLEAFAARFDDLFTHVAQRRGFRECLAGLLAPRDRNKTLTALAGAEPVVGSKDAGVQRLQYFVSESCWDPEEVNGRRLELLQADPATAAHPGGVLVVDDSGDRKDGTATAFTGRQWLGRLGKVDNGVVTVTTVWADERVYYPVHAQPYCPAGRLPGGREDPAFRTKWWIAADLAGRAVEDGFTFRAVTGDCAFGDVDAFRAALDGAGLPFVVAVRPKRGVWAHGPGTPTPRDAAGALAWRGTDDPGDWTPVRRRFRDGHTTTWWAADLRLDGWDPDEPTRLIVATSDPDTLPDNSTWYLVTNLPRPGGPHEFEGPHPAADLAEIVRIYGLRTWVEQSYKQIKDELGWADFQVRSQIAIRRHQVLVNCAFTFCWDAHFHEQPAEEPVTHQPDTRPAPPGERGGPASRRRPPAPTRTRHDTQLAQHATGRTILADPRPHAHALVEGLLQRAPAP